MSASDGDDQRYNTRKRAQKACKRCRDLKVRCSGKQPCLACSRRSLECQYADQSEKVLVTRRYLKDLQQRLSTLEAQVRRSSDHGPVHNKADNTSFEQQAEDSNRSVQSPQTPSVRGVIAGALPDGSVSLTNPLAFHLYNWVTMPDGRPMFLGTSSNWAFSRRVLNMTAVKLLGKPIPPDDLLFDSTVYDLHWDGNRLLSDQSALDLSILPDREFAIYLISSVKFHCCQLFHLFEEEDFMAQLELFHSDPVSHARSQPLWYAHYLLLLAFGNAFVMRSSKSGQPPGLKFFVQAMKCMPDFNFSKIDPIQSMQVLCCIALYLQSLCCRTAAYRAVDQALRIALTAGMHTDMRDRSLEKSYVQKCQRVWWTVYVLEREMSSFMGVPGGISEESVMTNHPEKGSALQIQVKLCQLLEKIDRTVYGSDGKLGSKYLGATQSVLRDIATVTEQMDMYFSLHSHETMEAISRLSASLHLLRHQCIIMTTRPLLYIFLQSRLGLSEGSLVELLSSQSIRGLLQICVESAQQNLRILSLLLDQGLLETFLPFDLEATFTSTTPLLMAASIDASILADSALWADRAYKILGEMGYRENVAAKMYRSELQQLQNNLNLLVAGNDNSLNADTGVNCVSRRDDDEDSRLSVLPTARVQAWDTETTQPSGSNYELSAEQLFNFADALDVDSLVWPLLDPVD